MKATEIRDLTQEEIEARIGELKEEQFRLRFRGATMPLENPMLLRSIRRDIARLQTVLTERKNQEGGR